MELSPSVIKKIKADKHYSTVVDYLASKVNELDTVDGVGDMPNELAGEEAKIRLKVKNKLYEILQPIFEFSEKELITEDMKKEREKDFGL